MLLRQMTFAASLGVLVFGIISATEVEANNDALKGAVIGAGVGALVGGKEGAVVGGIGGAIIGANK